MSSVGTIERDAVSPEAAKAIERVVSEARAPPKRRTPPRSKNERVKVARGSVTAITISRLSSFIEQRKSEVEEESKRIEEAEAALQRRYAELEGARQALRLLKRR